MDLFDLYSEEELLLIPVKNLGLKRNPWSFTRGMKLRREFFTEDNELRAAIEMEHVLSEGDRVSTPSKIKFYWYKIDGSIGLTKEVDLEYSVRDLENEHRKIRFARIDYMVGAAKELLLLSGTVEEPYKTQFIEASNSIDTILAHYEYEINSYEKKGSMDFENAVRNEADSSILSILSLIVRPPDDEFIQGLTIKQTILHQLTGEYNP